MKQINLNINDGIDFFAHEVSINFSPTQFTLDFKSVTPRIDPRAKDKPVFNLRHNVVLLDLWNAKQFSEILNSAISQYEKQFGKIKIPKALEKAQKNKNKKAKGKTKIKEVTVTPSYFG